MQQYPLLQTKLHIPPVRPDLVERPRLLQRLDTGLRQGHRLILISAPAGFGKTTLLASWISSIGDRRADIQDHLAWLSLDGDDDDPARFLVYLWAAVQKAGVDSGQDASWAQEGGSPLARSILTTLINGVAMLPHRLVLVLDDYHALSDGAIHRAMAFLLDHLPANMHLVIASRTDPPLPLARLRVRGQMSELHEADLRFTPDEVTTFLSQAMGFDLSPSDVAALEARTEGWIAGLQLAAVSMRDRDDAAHFVQSFSGSHRYVLDYLTDEVLRQQPPIVQEFLLETSILERLSGPLCDEVVGAQDITALASAQDSPKLRFPNSQSILEYLEAANLFVVPLDDRREWYRYHPLFADFLQAHLQHTAPERLPILHRRATAWYEGQGLLTEGIDHALLSGDFGEAARLVEAVAEATLMRSEITTYLRWVDALPDDMVRARPIVSLYHAWALFLAARPINDVLTRLRASDQVGGEVAGPTAILHAFLDAFQGQAPVSTELLNGLSTDAPFLRCLEAWYQGFSCLWLGDFEAASQALEQATKIGQEVGNVMIAVTALCHRAELHLLQGELRAARQVCEQALELAADDDGAPLPIAGMALIGLGELTRETDELDRAARLLEEGIELSKQWGEIGTLDGYIALARVQQAQGDSERAGQTMAGAERFARRFDATDLDDRFVAAHQARLWVMQGHLAQAGRWADEHGLSVEADDREVEKAEVYTSRYVREVECSVLARLLIRRGQLQEALIVLERLLSPLEKQGQWTTAMEIQVLRALALQALDRKAEAVTILGQALARAAPEGYVRLFADEGEPLVPLLREAAARGITPEYVGRLLDAIEEPALAAGTSRLVEPPSERELEVLRLIAAGLSNQEIADELVVALSTVKWHINNLYGKLGVSSRTQAVARAHEWHLL
jgi:LuxR family maltose regulon positive regulatory protein